MHKKLTNVDGSRLAYQAAAILHDALGQAGHAWDTLKTAEGRTTTLATRHEAAVSAVVALRDAAQLLDAALSVAIHAQCKLAAERLAHDLAAELGAPFGAGEVLTAAPDGWDVAETSTDEAQA